MSNPFTCNHFLNTLVQQTSPKQLYFIRYYKECGRNLKISGQEIMHLLNANINLLYCKVFKLPHILVFERSPDPNLLRIPRDDYI